MTANNSLKNLLHSVFEDLLKSSEYMTTIVVGVSSLAKQTTKLAEMVLRVQEKLQEHENVMLFLTEQHKKESPVDHFAKSSEKFSKPN